MIARRTLLAAVGGAAMASLANRRVGAQDSAGGPVASTAYGKVRGRASNGILIFKGVPYGAPTWGQARFRPPSPPTPWPGVRDAFDYAPAAPQPLPEPVPALFSSWTTDKQVSEDCLGLNIWTPGLRDGAKRPVMVWFHGGGYALYSGSSNRYNGERLARKGDVVVLTLNHRLNVFGFLYLAELVPELSDSGNVGMLDLIASLQWVQTNIAEFGGDPGNVTIFGQSGGGAKVSTLMAMPAAAGLFHRAIAQSGAYARNAHLEATKPDEATRHARSLLSAMEIAPTEVAKLAEIPMEALIAASVKVQKLPGTRIVFGPVADGRALPSGPWEPQAPACSARVPLIIGTTETETTLLVGAFEPDAFTLDDARLHRWLGMYLARGDIERVVTMFRASRPSASPSDLFFAITTAATLRKGTWLQADRKAAQGAAPVYLYELDWHTPVDSGKWGSPHALDAALVLDNAAVSQSMVGTGSDPQRIADQMSAGWLAFARTGDPNTNAIPNWPPYKPPERTTMVFNLQSNAVKGFRDDERELLMNLKTRGAFD
jgi:para-nitrobenzyl esterase